MSSIRILDNCLKKFSQMSVFSLPRINSNPIFLRTQLWRFPARSILTRSNEPYNFNSRTMLERLRLNDGIPPKYRLIYRANIASYLYIIQSGFLAMTIGGVVIIIINLFSNELSQDNEEKEEKPKINLGGEQLTPFFNERSSILVESFEEFALFVAAFAVFTFSLSVLMRRLPIRIYAHPNKNVLALFCNPMIPGRKSIHQMVAGTLTQVSSSQMVFKDATGKKMILMEHYFQYPADLHFLTDPDQHLVTDDDYGENSEEEKQ